MKTDCLIIGGGLAGRMAAREAVEAGLHVAILQDGQGASPWVHGFNAPVVRDGDNAEVFYQDTQVSGQGLSDPNLAHTLCYDAEANFKDLLSWGLPFNRKDGQFQALRPLGASYARVVSIGNETGVAVLKMLDEKYRNRWQDLPGCRAVRLIKDGSRVTGAVVYDQKKDEWFTVTANAVVLACGGYCGIFPVSTNKRDSGGDAIAMAYEAGAKLCDMEFIQFEPSAAVWPKALIGTSVITTLFFEGAVLRNKDGERFMLKYGPDGERVGKDVLARCIAAEVAEGRGSEHGGVYMDITGCDPDTLNKDYFMYVKRYADVGIDLTKEWIELGPAPHTSLGGIWADENGCTGIEGLFVCGQALGGLHGANRIGGSAGLETFVFGRRAGKTAADYAVSHPDYRDSDITAPVFGAESILEQITSLREKMKSALSSGLSAVRDAAHLKQAIDDLNCIKQTAETLKGANGHEEFLRCRLCNDVTAGLLTAEAALARTHSLGCHYRSDDDSAKEPAFRVLIASSPAGPVITKELIEG